MLMCFSILGMVLNKGHVKKSKEKNNSLIFNFNPLRFLKHFLLQKFEFNFLCIYKFLLLLI